MQYKHLSVGVVLSLLGLSQLQGAHAQDGEELIEFSIPRQRASSALYMFARQADVQALFPAARARAIFTNRVVGRYSREDALRELLRDTILAAHITDDGLLVLGYKEELEEDGMKKTKNTLATSIALLLAAPPVLAQTTGVLEEVVVTAERREQNLQDIPIAATVLSANEIARRGVHNLNDIQSVAPSLSINQVNRSTYVNIRGVGIAQTSPSSGPGVAYYIDGVLIPHEQFISQSFYDLETVEVLRGPQGTLTGQNSTGGAIYVRTPQPEFGEYFGYIDQTLGNYDWSKTVVAGNLGFTDNIALRVAAVRETRDSFTSNRGPSSSDPGNVDMTSARFNLAMRALDDDLRFNLRGEYFKTDTDNNAVVPYGQKPFVIHEDGKSFWQQEGYRLAAEVRYALSDSLELRALTSFQDGSNEDQADGDRSATAQPIPAGLPASGANRAIYPGRIGYTDTTFETWVHEINLIGGEGPLNWVVGGFLLEEEIPAAVYRDNYNTHDFVSPSPGSEIDTKITNNSKSIFGQVNYFVTDTVELIGGARHSWDRQAYDRFAAPGPDSTGKTVLETEKLTGKLGVNWHVGDDTMLYVSASKGYKAGGGNLPMGVDSFGPETNYVYEGGVKTTLLDRRLRVNAAVFYSDYDDIQFASLANGLPLTQNAASAESYGAEVEINGQFGALAFNLGAGWLQAEFADDTFLQNTLTNQNELVRSGDVLPFSPEWTINAGIQYDIDLANGMTLTPRLQWNHTSESYSTPFRSARTKMSSRDVVDLRVTLVPTDNVRVEAFATNLFDEEYETMQLMNSSSADGGTLWGAPRQYGMRIRYDF